MSGSCFGQCSGASKRPSHVFATLPARCRSATPTGPSTGLWSSVSDLIFLPENAQPPSTSNSKYKKCVFKEMDLKNSLMDSVVQQETVTSIPDVRQHVSEQAVGLLELLFAVDTQPPRAMLLLPLFTSAGTICGGLYILSLVAGNLMSIQHEAEVLLAIASETIAKAMLSQQRARPT